MILPLAAEAADDNFVSLMDRVARSFEALGAVILVVGVIWSLALAVVTARQYGWSERAYLVVDELCRTRLAEEFVNAAVMGGP
jgi:hypothetical protein